MIRRTLAVAGMFLMLALILVFTLLFPEFLIPGYVAGFLRKRGVGFGPSVLVSAAIVLGLILITGSISKRFDFSAGGPVFDAIIFGVWTLLGAMLFQAGTRAYPALMDGWQSRLFKAPPTR